VEKAVKAGSIGGVEPRHAARNDHGDWVQCTIYW
jgi:hypothetical protein